ncbi:MAG: glycosyltransferase family 4 protein [Eubacteriales bacterium]|nr:glycosyltransferase family 4 protein [Eubacteriales bacterium]
MKVLIISSCNLPVPAVLGGAVSTLVESIIEQNELQGKMELTVVSLWCPEIEKAAGSYPNTRFIFIRVPDILKKPDAILDRLKNDGKKHDYLRKLYILPYLKKVLAEGDYDRVVFQNSGYLLRVLKSKALAEKYQGKLYYHLHNVIPSNVPVDCLKKCRMLLISRYLIKGINALCKEDMERSCTVVKNGFDTELFSSKLSSEEKQRLLKKLGIAENKKILLFAGRIVKQKGVMELAEAFLSRKRDDAVLLIVGAVNFGTGDSSDFEKKLTEKLSAAGDRVVFTGFVPYSQMWKYYAVADVAVLPSMWEEPAGLTMIEAAAAGVPVITTRSGGIREYLPESLALFIDRDENTVASIYDAIDEVFNDTKKWKETAQKAADHVKANFSKERFYYDFFTALGG